MNSNGRLVCSRDSGPTRDGADGGTGSRAPRLIAKTLYGRRTKRSRIILIAVVAASRCSSRRQAASHDGGEALRPGRLGRLDLDLGNGQRTHSAASAVGVIRVMSASRSWQRELSISGARRLVKDQRRVVLRLYVPCNRAAAAALHFPGSIDRLGDLPAARSTFSLTAAGVRRFGGCSRRRRNHARPDSARTHSRGRITSRWSRRAHCPVRSCHRGARLSASVRPTCVHLPARSVRCFCSQG